MTEPGSTRDGPSAPGPGQRRGQAGPAGDRGSAGSSLSDPASWEDPYDDDLSGGLRDQLSAEELSWLCDPGEEPDGPDPDLHPEAYPDLDNPTVPSGGDRTRVLVSALKPGPTLAGLLDDCVPEQMVDGALAESLAAWRRMASWAAAGELSAIAELAGRRAPRLWDHTERPDDPPDAGAEPVTVSREAIEEIALALTLTHWSASTQASLAVSLARRLPATLAALSAGCIDLPRARLIDDATVTLTDENAQRVEARILPRASRMTTGELREALRRLVISIDPAAAEKRRKHAERHARVRLYGDNDHTATLAGEKLPAACAAAAYARISAIAAAMKAAGLPGSTELLQSQVFAGLLLGTLPHIPQPRPGPDDPGPGEDGSGEAGPDHDDPNEGGPDSGGPDSGGPDQGDPDQGDPGESSPGEGRGDAADQPDRTSAAEQADHNPANAGPPTWPKLPVPGGAAAAGCAEVPAAFRSPAGRLQLAVPWRTLLGLVSEPGRLGWIGPVTPQTSREIAAAAAADPACAWKVIITDDEGRALAVTRLRRRRASSAARTSRWWPGSGQPARQPGSPAPPPRSRDPDGHPGQPLDPLGELGRLGQPGLTGQPGQPGQPGLVKAITLTLPHALIGTFTGEVRERVREVMRASGMSGLTGAESLGDVLGAAMNAAAAKIAADRTAAAGNHPPSTAGAMPGTGPARCPHTDQAAGYRVPRSMRDFLQARDVTCRFAVCRQPAWHSDADHTIPYDQGGRTCSCNLGNTCRTHHQLKQLPDWTLEQPSPGIFIWRTPSGLSYAVTPDRHPA